MNEVEELAHGSGRPGASTAPGAGPLAHDQDVLTLPTITDDMLAEYQAAARPYTLVILKAGPQSEMPGADRIIREHGRRFLALRAAGLLPLIFPVAGRGDVWGTGIFNVDPDAVRRIMAHDPAVQAGVIIFEIHPARSFPGDALPRPVVGDAGGGQSQPAESDMERDGGATPVEPASGDVAHEGP